MAGRTGETSALASSDSDDRRSKVRTVGVKHANEAFAREPETTSMRKQSRRRRTLARYTGKKEQRENGGGREGGRGRCRRSPDSKAKGPTLRAKSAERRVPLTADCARFKSQVGRQHHEGEPGSAGRSGRREEKRVDWTMSSEDFALATCLKIQGHGLGHKRRWGSS